jgi:hypothetical protein
MSTWNGELSVMAKTEVSIIIALTPGITPEQARDIRARAWRFVFDCSWKREAARPGGPNDAIVRNTEEVSHVEQRPS